MSAKIVSIRINEDINDQLMSCRRNDHFLNRSFVVNTIVTAVLKQIGDITLYKMEELAANRWKLVFDDVTLNK